MEIFLRFVAGDHEQHAEQGRMKTETWAPRKVPEASRRTLRNQAIPPSSPAAS